MEDYVRENLNFKILKNVGSLSGCINTGNVYETDKGKIFVKSNSESEALAMFQGEFEALKKLFKTKTVKVPEPFLTGKVGKRSFIVMEYLNLKSLNKFSANLGKSLANLHLDNIKALQNKEKKESNIHLKEADIVESFGFHKSTACGYLLQNNEWSNNWVEFYSRKLQHQVDMILQNKGSREINEMWSHLHLKISSFFEGITIEPSLLHGDLWIGNAGETDNEPVIYDPASFYGHHEYDLAIAMMFGGFKSSFFNSYHAEIPQGIKFLERHQLYLLFHHLNHWNHFGSHKTSSLSIMKNLIK